MWKNQVRLLNALILLMCA